MKKQSRRHFIKDKLWKGLILSLFNPFSSMAKFDGSQEESITTKDDGITPDWEKVKSQFTLVNSRKHFNTASIGPSPRIVQDTTIASINFVNVNPEQLAITRNATEGMNIVARSLKLNQGDEVIITSEEHIGGSAPWMTLQNEIGIKVKVVNILGNEEKFVKLIKSSISDRTKVISISHITCTTGTVLPVKEIIEFCKKNQIQSVIDGTQALGQISLNLKSLQPNFFIASCHKWLFGPKGTGILYMNQDFLNNTPPLFAGAYTDQKFDLKKGIYEYVKHASRYEYGTINSPIIAGLGAAVEFMDKVGIKNVEDRGKNLAERFRNKVSQHNDIFFLTPDQLDNYASIITFRIKHKNGSNVCKELRKTSNIVLRSVTENNMNAIRASFALYTNEKEVDELAQKLLIIANQ
jgi:cysteine desulfurase/selenocysteine lyase